MLNQSQLSIEVWKRFPASLFLEDVVNQLKSLFALSVAQDVSSLEKYGSIFLKSNRDGVELPSTLKFCHEIAHVGKQGFENTWLFILLYCLKNHCLQLRPGWRLTRPRFRLEGRCALTTDLTVLVLRLAWHLRVIGRSCSYLVLEGIRALTTDLAVLVLRLAWHLRVISLSSSYLVLEGIRALTIGHTALFLRLAWHLRVISRFSGFLVLGCSLSLTIDHTVLVLRLACLLRVISRFSGLLFLEDVINLLKRLFALRVAQAISSLEKFGSILLKFNRDGGELPSTLKLCYQVAHFFK